MFKSKTLFIVGAGASCEAGLPSGHDLKRRISDQLEINVIDGAARSGTYEALMHKSMALKDSFVNYKNAAKQISRAMPLAISIDNYLDAHAHDSRIELCGKLAIVEAILESEKKSSLYPAESLGHTIKFRNIENTWYTAFFKVLSEKSKQQSLENIFDNISFITFNYDRCIEQFIANSLAAYFGINKNDVGTLMQKLNIVHPYGLIGDLPDYNKNNDIKSIKFGQDPLQLRPEQLIDLATNIKIFTQQLEDEKILHTMSSLVSEPETIVFLGFAFHEQNMELLKPSPNNHVKNVYATLKGVSESDSLVIESQITRMFNTRNRRLVPPRLNLKNMTCSQLFYDFYRSIGS